MERTETKNDITITATLNMDGSVNLGKKMKFSFPLPDGTIYEGEGYPEPKEGFNVGGMAAQFEFLEAIRKLKTAVQRGGKREGAGRKPKGESKKIQVGWWLDPTIVEIIRSQPNQAEYIEKAVWEKMERDAALS